jgi:hypothetical protein
MQPNSDLRLRYWPGNLVPRMSNFLFLDFFRFNKVVHAIPNMQLFMSDPAPRLDQIFFHVNT